MDDYEFLHPWNGTHCSANIRHKPCGTIYQVSSPIDFLGRGINRCPVCQKKSKGETKIESFLKTTKIDYVCQYRISEWKKAPYDFFLPEYNILIEFQGEQHCHPVDKFGGEDSYKLQKEIDCKKRILAEKLGYKIIYFYYYEFQKLEELLVQRLSEVGVNFQN